MSFHSILLYKTKVTIVWATTGTKPEAQHSGTGPPLVNAR